VNSVPEDTRAADFLFDLPPELIAQSPSAQRSQSRLLAVGPDGSVRDEHPFSALPDLLQRGDLVVLNDSRVLPARLETRRPDTGGRVEILLIEPGSGPNRWLAMARPARRLRTGVVLEILGAPDAEAGLEPTGDFLTVVENHGTGEVTVEGSVDPAVLASRRGVMPLPPYIRRDYGSAADRERMRRDRTRYQTVFATAGFDDGASVAAPTAGLHFDAAVLESLAAHGVAVERLRLHVGPGTFRPPDENQIRSRRLHAERFFLSADLWRKLADTRAAGGRIIAVGTTSLRVLETVARLDLERNDAAQREFPNTGDPVFSGSAWRRGEGWEVAGTTRLFLMPPEKVAAVDGLLTNFHLPGSSLLMLLAAFLQPGDWRPIYREAVTRRLGFYSYGDCMLSLKRERKGP